MNDLARTPMQIGTTIQRARNRIKQAREKCPRCNDKSKAYWDAIERQHYAKAAKIAAEGAAIMAGKAIDKIKGGG